MSDPSSSTYRHFLTPSQYQAQFGPSAKDTAAVTAWLKGQGFSGVKAVGNSGALRATAKTSAVQSAFGVKLKTYRVLANGTHQTVVSNDRAVTLPQSIAGKVLAVTGLNSAAPTTFHTAKNPAKLAKAERAAAASPASKCSTYWGQHQKVGIPKFHNLTKLNTHICGYNGKQLRAAYNLTSAQTGKGTTIAYIEIGTPYKMAKTLKTWAAKSGLPAPTSSNYRELAIGSGSACGNEFDVEEQLDVEAGYAMAPKAHHLLIGGDSCDTRLSGAQPLFDAIQTVLDGNGRQPLASIASNSWGFNSESVPAVYSKLAHAQLLQAASEGVTMAFASGDYSGAAVPATDPYALSVGGTSLALGKTNNRIFETGWSNAEYEMGKKGYYYHGLAAAAGGGVSTLWKQPSYQKCVVPSSMSTAPGDKSGASRTAPDISADADMITGINQLIMEPGDDGGADESYWFVDGGTSLATPLIAGILADAQQGSSTWLGYVNPTLYKLAGTSAFHDTLPVTSKTTEMNRQAYCPAWICDYVPSVWTFDMQSRAWTDQVTAKGYDTMTGLGTPNGPKFVAALHKK